MPGVHLVSRHGALVGHVTRHISSTISETVVSLEPSLCMQSFALRYTGTHVRSTNICAANKVTSKRGDSLAHLSNTHRVCQDLHIHGIVRSPVVALPDESSFT